MAEVRHVHRVGAVHAVAALALGVSVVAVSAASGCRRESEPFNTAGVASLTTCGVGAGANRYLPEGLLFPASPYPRSLRDDYSTLLAAISEPSLFCGHGSGSLTYRLARLEWAGVPLIIRVELSDATGTMWLLKLEAPSWNFPPGKVTEQRSVSIDGTQRRDLIDAVDRADLWAMPTISRANDTGLGEGTTWILEALDSNRYHLVSRWLPTSGSPLLALGRTIMRYAGVTEAELKGDAPGVVMRPPRPQRGDPPPPPG